jgi:MFS family permease
MQQHTSHHKVLPWLGWFVASLAGLYQFLLQTSTSVMIPDLEHAFGLDALGVSILSSSFFYTYLICQIPAGILIDYFRPRRTITICQITITIACVLFAMSSSVWSAAASRILMGLFCAPTIVAALYLVARTLPERYFALVAGLTETMGMLGGVAGQALLARSVMHFGWRHTMLILATVALTMAISAWLIVRDDIQNESSMKCEGNKRHVWQDLYAMLKLPQAWINGLYCGLTFGIVAAFGAFWCIPYLMQRYGIMLGQAADASSMIFIGAAVGAPFIGWLSGRLGIKRQLMIIWPLIAGIIFGVIVYMPGVSMPGLFVLIFLLGFFSGVYLLPFAVMRDITPAHMRGTAMGYINMMCILIGSPVLQPSIGWILNAHRVISVSAYQHAFLVILVSTLIAVVLGYFVRET